MFCYFAPMKSTYFFLLFCGIFFFSCNKNPLEKVWIYNADPSKEQMEQSKAYGRDIDIKYTPANFINIKEDGSYTAYLKNFSEGKWFLKEQNLVLVNKDRIITEFELHSNVGNKLVLSNKMKRLVYHFDGYPNDFGKEEDNPFAAVNNQWRLKSRHKESDKELAARIKNHLHFWKQYFAWGHKKSIGYLDVRSTPSLLKLYGNGMEMEYYDNLLPEWKNTYYDSTDCRIAYEMLYYKMHEKDVKWLDTKNKFERLASAFAQMEKWMDEKPSSYIRRK